MAEKIWGSFSFNIIDDKNSTYLVKETALLRCCIQSTKTVCLRQYRGNPVARFDRHFPFTSLKAGAIRCDSTFRRDIFKIDEGGERFPLSFEYFRLQHALQRQYTYNYPFYETEEEEDYLENIKKAAIFEGFDLFLSMICVVKALHDEISDFVLSRGITWRFKC
jgi:hypothetical protein